MASWIYQRPDQHSYREGFGWLFKEVAPEKRWNEKRAPEETVDGVTKEDRCIYCRFCGLEISHESAIFQAQSHEHQHIFINPSGIVYDILTLKYARGLLLVGERSSDFSWFPGYSWEVALCQSCHNHLGWQFFSGDQFVEDTFYGLIRKRLLF